MTVLASVAIAAVLAVEPSSASTSRPASATSSSSDLPLRKVRLYETGVGYFERRGNVTPRGDLSLPLPASHLDDALKSLVILESSGSVKIEGVQFDTSVSEGMARAMAGLPAHEEEALAYDVVLASLKGSRVQLDTADGRIRGRLVDLEGPFFPPAPKTDAADTTPPQSRGEPHFTLIVLDDDDALRRVKTDVVSGVKVLDGQTAKRLDVAATALSNQGARQTASLDVQVGRGGRLGLGYISESAVWRTTYRVVMDREHEQGQLQAWALVHNDTDEDWDKVHIELANGRPASFLHPLASPRYAQRELIDAPEGLSTVPQLANTTADRLQGTEIGEAYGVGGLGLVGHGRGGGGMGYGVMGVGSVSAESGGIELSDLAELAQAAGSESGALFLYRVVDPVDIGAHHSALLPIVQDDIEVESITLFASGDSEGLSAARLVNTTRQTLPPGTVSFFADGGFVGEAIFDRLKPDERRFVPYGFELDVELARVRRALGEQVTVLRYRDKTIVESYLEQTELSLSFDNRSGGTRRVYAVLDLPRHADLTGDGVVELDYDLANDAPLAATTVPSGGTVEHKLNAKILRSREHTQFAPKALSALAKKAGVPAKQREILEESIAHQRASIEHEAHVREARSSIGHLERDLSRIRKDLTALGDAGVRSGARARLSRELFEKEARIDTLQDEIREAERAVVRERKRSRASLERLNDWRATAD